MLKIVFQENLITRYKYFFLKHRKTNQLDLLSSISHVRSAARTSIAIEGYVVFTGNCQHCFNDAIFSLEKGPWTRGLMVYVLHRGKNDSVTLIFT